MFYHSGRSRLHHLTMKKLLPFAALALLSSCNGISVAGAYHLADQATFDAIAPEYERYIKGDENIDEAGKASRLRTILSWKMRLEAQPK